MRLFVAVEIPAAIREVLARGLSGLKRDLPEARWVRVESLHLTLMFIGEQPEPFVAAIDEIVRARAARLQPVEVALGGSGFFPDERRPRVAWLGGRADGLAAWAEAVDEGAAALGVSGDARPFSLHLTLARLEPPWGPQAVEGFRLAVGRWRLPSFSPHEMVLFSSELRPAGAVHTALRRWAVGGGDAC